MVRKLAVFAVIASMVPLLHAQQCADYNAVVGPFPYVRSDKTHHSSGAHTLTISQGGSSTYSSATGLGPCTNQCTATSTSKVVETGSLDFATSVKGLIHIDAQASKGGSGTALYPAQVMPSTEGGGGADECYTPFCGVFSASISAVGAGVTFNKVPLWHDGNVWQNVSCIPRSGTKVNSCGGSKIQGGLCVQGSCGCTSPIVIDTQHQGFHLTDPSQADGYVSFLFDGVLKKASFPDWRFENAFLVVMYDENGKRNVFEDARDLEGAFSPHADGGMKDHPNPNGFLDLQYRAVEYATKAGRDYSGILSKKETPELWSRLGLWFPKHCHLHPDVPCKALDSEVVPLSEHKRIHSLSLVYDVVGYQDPSGSYGQYAARINPTPGKPQESKDGSFAVDFNLSWIK